ncbi:MAG: PhnA domain-containing protein [Chitinophagaceae bacterium]
MKHDKELQKRSQGVCELCASNQDGAAFTIASSPDDSLNAYLWLCPTCISQIENPSTADENHWRLLTESIWSENKTIQVLSWRLLHKFAHLPYASDTLDIAYLDEDTMAWAQADGTGKIMSDSEMHKDSNGNILANGDSVVLIKTLDVKGASFDAKMGTVVKNIKLVENNTEQIEGKVNGSQIVILTKYVRKA